MLSSAVSPAQSIALPTATASASSAGQEVAHASNNGSMDLMEALRASTSAHGANNDSVVGCLLPQALKNSQLTISGKGGMTTMQHQQQYHD